jgi:hypothetical protein
LSLVVRVVLFGVVVEVLVVFVLEPLLPLLLALLIQLQ